MFLLDMQQAEFSIQKQITICPIVHWLNTTHFSYRLILHIALYEFKVCIVQYFVG